MIATLRALTEIFSRYSRQAITSLVYKFEWTYSLCDVTVPVRQRPNDPNQPFPRYSQELRIELYNRFIDQ